MLELACSSDDDGVSSDITDCWVEFSVTDGFGPFLLVNSSR